MSLGQIRACKNSQKLSIFDTQQPDSPRGLLRTWKNRKKPAVFDVFWRFSLIFAFFKKRPYVAKRVVRTILRTNSGTPKSQKTFCFWHSTPVFPERGAPDQKKSQKTLSFWHSTVGFPQRVAPKIWKSQKTLNFWHFLALDTHFPWEGLHGHVFRDYWVALK